MNLDNLFLALGSETRRKIICELYAKESLSFTEIMEIIGADTGKTSFHLKKLEGLVFQDDKKKYMLTEEGMKAHNILKSLEYRPQKIKTTKTEMITARRIIAFAVDLIFMNIVIYFFISFAQTMFSSSHFIYPFLPRFSFYSFWKNYGIIYTIYFMVLEGHYGFSVGKFVLGLNVTIKGRQPNYTEVLIKNISKTHPFLLASDIFFAQLIYIFERRWHLKFTDILSNTKIETVSP